MGCSPDQGPVASTPDEPAAKIAADQVAPGRYIVVLEDNVDDAEQVAIGLARRHGAAPEHIYRHALKGFSVALSARAADELAADPQVKYVEPDYIATAIGSAQGKPGGGGGGTASQTTPWGITRVGDAGNGTGKTAWVIDTGIDLDHPDLNVDVSRSRNFATGASPDDGNGHGTHVAGTIAAINNTQGVVGVAANAKVVAVRVLDNRGSGYYSWVIAGVDYVAATASLGDVANMSLGGPPSQALDDAVRNAARGVLFSIAAGNDAKNANNYSPARVETTNVYTVSAIDSGDNFAYFSNYGDPPVDYAAPGVSVLSTWKGGGTKTLSGTSMAAPHVAGLLLRGGIYDCGTAIGDKDTTPDPIPCSSAP